MKSTTSFIRQQLKIKGKSEHNGRGVWGMDMTEGYNYFEVLERINNKMALWKSNGLVESYEQTEEEGVRTVIIKFNEEIFNPFYCTFYMNDRMADLGMLGSVQFSSPRDSARALLNAYGVEV